MRLYIKRPNILHGVEYHTSISNPSLVMNSALEKKTWATFNIASSSHSSYQSMVQQFMRAGFIRQRWRNFPPAGLMVSTTWRFCLTRWMKNWYTDSWVSGISASEAACLRSIRIPSRSSESNRSGTSPEFRIQLMSSKKDSLKKSIRKILALEMDKIWFSRFLNHASMSWHMSSTSKYL